MESNCISSNKITINERLSKASTDISQNKDDSIGRLTSKLQRISSISIEDVKLDTISEESTQNNQNCTEDEKNKNKNEVKIIFIENGEIDEKLPCLICREKFDEKKMLSFGCKHYMCNLCIKDYIISKVRIETVPFCHQQNCETFLSLTCKLFFELPGEVQEKFSQIFLKMEMVGRNSIGESPSFHKMENEKTIANADKDKSIHEDPKEYRKCKKCNVISDKISEEMKISCKCGQNYCYLCGKRWIPSGHNCKYLKRLKDYQSQLLKEEKEKNRVKRSIFKQCFVELLWVPLFLFLLVPKAVLFFIALIIASLMAGMTFYSVSYVLNLDKTYKKVFFVIFFPIAMILGIGMALTIFFNGFVMEEIECYYKIKECLLSI